MYYLGIDVGGMSIKAGVVTDDGKILSKLTCITKRNDYKEMVKDMATLSLDTIKEANLTIDDIKSIGMGIPGSVNSDTGIVYFSNNLGFENADIVGEYKKYIDKDVFIGNDANVAALGEYYALNDENINNFVLVTLGTGIGGGVILNKKLHTGFNHIAGEIGHMSINFSGNDCNCGTIGCWETYASATALLNLSLEKAKKYPDSYLAKLINENSGRPNGKMPFDASKKDDIAGSEVVSEYIHYLGVGLVNVINILQPEVIAIGGGVCNQGEYLLEPIREYVHNNAYSYKFVENSKIVKATLGNDAGIIGAAFLGK